MSSVFFRALELEDLPFIHKWMNDQEMLKDAIGMKRPMSMVECKEWLERRVKPDTYNFWFAICLNDESKQIIGYTGVNSIHYVNSSATCDAVVIGEKEYRDGISWIETYLFIFDFIFNKLHLNRFYGEHSETQKTTSATEQLFFLTREGIGREALYMHGRYINVVYKSLLRREYLKHLNNGEYELSSIIKRIKLLKKKNI